MNRKKRNLILIIIFILLIILISWISGIIPKQIAKIYGAHYLKKNFLIEIKLNTEETLNN